jgi:hypothetical protein
VCRWWGLKNPLEHHRHELRSWVPVRVEEGSGCAVEQNDPMSASSTLDATRSRSQAARLPGPMPEELRCVLRFLIRVDDGFGCGPASSA